MWEGDVKRSCGGDAVGREESTFPKIQIIILYSERKYTPLIVVASSHFDQCPVNNYRNYSPTLSFLFIRLISLRRPILWRDIQGVLPTGLGRTTNHFPALWLHPSISQTVQTFRVTPSIRMRCPRYCISNRRLLPLRFHHK